MACILSPCVETGAASSATGASSTAPQPSPFQPSPMLLRSMNDSHRGVGFDDTLTASAREQAQRVAAKVAAEAARQGRGRGGEDEMTRGLSPKCAEPSSPMSDDPACCCPFFANCWDPAVRAWIVRLVGFAGLVNFIVTVSLDRVELLAAGLSAAVAWMALYNHAVQKDCRSLLAPHEARGIDPRAVVLKGMAAAGPGLGSTNHIGGIADTAIALDSDIVSHAMALGVDMKGAGVPDDSLQTMMMSSMANEYLRSIATLRYYQAKYGRLAGVPDCDDFTVRHLLGELGFAAAAAIEGGCLLRSPAPAPGHGHAHEGEGTKSSTFGSWPQLGEDLDRLELDVTASSFNSIQNMERGRGSGDVRDVPPAQPTSASSSNIRPAAGRGTSGASNLPALSASQSTNVEDLGRTVDDSRRSIDASRKSSKISAPVAPVAPTGGAPPSPAMAPSPMPKNSIEDSSTLPPWLRAIRS